MVSTPAALAAKTATATIPVIMAASADPVGGGVVETLARPGGNVTGLAHMNPDLTREAHRDTQACFSESGVARGIASGSVGVSHRRVMA